MQQSYTEASNNTFHVAIPSFRLIEKHLLSVKELVDQNLKQPSIADEIKPLNEYLRSRTGKMLRPGLVLLAGKTCGKITNEHIKVAAVVEMIHTATLLHDDVIDDGQLRRGLPSVNRLWGNESAVLLGDFILGRVFKICADLDPIIAQTIATIAMCVCQGELRQVIHKRNWQLTEQQYIEIITEKSAAFFSGCCRLGALLTNAKKPLVETLAIFGLNAGIAFQITDDLLDITGQENRTGKTIGSDVSKSKLTLAMIHLLKNTDPADRNELFEMLDDPVKYGDTLIERLRNCHSLEYTRNTAQQFVKKAVESLKSLENNRAKSALIETAMFMTNRAT